MSTIHSKFGSLYTLAACTTLGISALPAIAANTDTERPNIVWFLTEDLSPHFLAMFNDGVGCTTPNLEQLAQEGIVYTNAYGNAPVSSAARTTLITGCYAPRFAGSLHRRLTPMPMPEGLNMFPTYLRNAGYYTTNCAKTDYNVVLDEGAWNKINGKIDDWTQRADKSQPFFFMRSKQDTHESRLQFSEETYRTKKTDTDPNAVHIHSFLPDTELMRYTYATFYDRIHDTDTELGEVVEMLRKEGELENTFIFFFGDNGGTLPGTKGYTDNIGFQVPLVVYVPETWRDKIDQPIGSVQDALVSFIDFAPTTLNLANAEIPEQMDGTPFLGKNSIKGHEAVFCYGDRYDELYAFNRSVRKGDFRYARNFQPYHTQSLQATYRYKQLAFEEWRTLFQAGQLNAEQSSFFQPFGAEELYDLANDPAEKHNLVANPQYNSKLKELRGELNSYMVEKNDLGFFPENIVIEEGIENPDNFGFANKARIQQFLTIANLQMSAYTTARPQIKEALASSDDVERWWALTTIASFGDEAKELVPTVQQLLAHPRSYVRARALVALARMGASITPSQALEALHNCKNAAETMVVLNDYTFLVEAKLIEPFQLSVEDLPETNMNIDWRIEYLNKCYHIAKKITVDF